MPDERGTLVLPAVSEARINQGQTKPQEEASVGPRPGCAASALISKIKAQTNLSRRIRLRFKLLISAALIAGLFVFGRVDLHKSIEAALTANPWYLGLAALAYVTHIILNAYRWAILAEVVGLKKPFGAMVQYYYVGMFFNLFLPSTVGGDMSRCYYLSRDSGKYVNSFYSVIADRMAGLAVLFLMAAWAMTWGSGGASLPWQLKAPVFAGTLLIFVLLPFAPQLCKIVLGPRNWLTRQLTHSAAAAYWEDRSLIVRCLMWSVLLQLIMVAAHVAIGLALGLTIVPLWYYLVFYPCVTVLGFVAPSFNGIGIREWAYTYFLSAVGVDRSQALTYAIMWLTYSTLMSLLGGIVYLAGHFKKISPAQIEEIEGFST